VRIRRWVGARGGYTAAGLLAVDEDLADGGVVGQADGMAHRELDVLLVWHFNIPSGGGGQLHQSDADLINHKSQLNLIQI
jgi:hypothetical protein